VLLRVDGHDDAAGRVARTIPLVFSMSGETFDVGVDTGSAVGPYPHGFECTARILGVTLERLSEPPAELAARIAAGEHAAGLATH
jgi:arylsulfatase